MKIIVVSGVALCTNPRVVKEADALAALGHEVTVVAALTDPSRQEDERRTTQGKTWQPLYLFDITNKGLRNRLYWLAIRIRRRLGIELGRRLGIRNHWELGYFVPELNSYCATEKADLFSLHNEGGLWVGTRLLRDKRNISIDFEDWYSENQAMHPDEYLKSMERMVLTHCAFSTTTSKALAVALSTEFNCPAPVVIYNTFPVIDSRPGHIVSGRLSVCWFSQTIGPGRGLERLINTIENMDGNIELHLIGKPSSASYLEALMGDKAYIQQHNLVAPDHLGRLLQSFDVGFAGELTTPPSRDLTIANKVFQYLASGLPVIASNTSGQREIAEELTDCIRIFHDDKGLRDSLAYWRNPEHLEFGQEAAHDAATHRYNSHESYRVLENLLDTLRL
ncbi:MAG: glycosyltransferase [Pseudomonadales bacterium]|nr:glycosyltransferase [Pseudomonadales bacterium]MBO7004759.1 glycosyltransferase [Pseudomonadales bacterium]